jgi:two-component system heavy metal sensor histidine kinase CusS
MSSTTARKPWSLAARMTAWYGLTAVAVAGSGVGAVYLTVRLAIDREIAREFPAAARELHAQRQELTAGGLRQDSPVVRVVAPDGAVAFESSPLAAEFPADAFPPPGAGPIDRRAGAGTPYTLAAEQVDGWAYHFALDRSQEAEFSAKVHLGLGLAVVPTLAVGLAVGYLLARLGLRPVRRIARAMQDVSTDRLDARMAADRLPAELQDLAETLNAVLARLEEAFERLDQFSADVAHELRTPVHNLRQVAEIGLASAGGPGDDRQALGRVLDESDRLTRLIERLLLFARLSDPRAGLTRTLLRVVDELAAVADFFASAAAEAGVRLVVDAPPELAFPADDGLFQRAVSNLVANAVAHTPTGGEVRLTAVCDDHGLRVEIADTGRGIAADDLPKLFDRFYRPPAARAAGRGVGLGLAIVRRAVELHGGTVAVESTPGSGTRVRLHFPVASRDDTDVIPLPSA